MVVLAGVADQHVSAKSPRSIVLVGEVHGTKEIPLLFANMVRVNVAAANGRIGIGLELPTLLQPIVDDAVRTPVSRDVLRSRLLRNAIWQSLNDGRSSEAMLELVLDMAELAQLPNVSLFFFDTQVNERDDTMARLISERVQQGGYELTLILTGNIHANKAPQFPRHPSIVPMGWKLGQRGFRVHSFDVRYGEGEAWVCIPDCGIHHLKGATAIASSQSGYDGTLYVGPISASPPARLPP
jgi:hypothetical protein